VGDNGAAQPGPTRAPHCDQQEKQVQKMLVQAMSGHSKTKSDFCIFRDLGCFLQVVLSLPDVWEEVDAQDGYGADTQGWL